MSQHLARRRAALLGPAVNPPKLKMLSAAVPPTMAGFLAVIKALHLLQSISMMGYAAPLYLLQRCVVLPQLSRRRGLVVYRMPKVLSAMLQHPV